MSPVPLYLGLGAGLQDPGSRSHGILAEMYKITAFSQQIFDLMQFVKILAIIMTRVDLDWPDFDAKSGFLKFFDKFLSVEG